jgi:signal transduction histidine kinase
MTFLKNTLLLKRIALLISFTIVTLILWNTYTFFVKFKTEERMKMEIVATAMQEFAMNQDLNADFSLEDKIIKSNTNIPMILVDEYGKIGANSYTNLDSIKAKDPAYLSEQLIIMKEQNSPIEINFFKNKKQYVYYRNSDLLNKLSYYPLALILILALFLSVIYMMFTSSKVAEQNKLWTGMAKETAHQIGTPLSSLMAWIELLREREGTESMVFEMEKDIKRLETITDRFSKIGSKSELQKVDVVALIRQSIEYLKSRMPVNTLFTLEFPDKEIIIPINSILLEWVVENLVKNSVDAMKGKGEIKISITEGATNLILNITDNGDGIDRSILKNIFKPGVTSKKRGWGLGLSLSKRIVEEYHKGSIFVMQSEKGIGTTFSIHLPKSLNPTAS